MKIYSTKTSLYVSKNKFQPLVKPSFSGEGDLPCQLNSIVKNTLMNFSKKISNNLPDVNLYCCDPLTEEFKKINKITANKAKLELHNSLNKNNLGVKRLILTVYDKQNPEHKVSTPLLIGTKNEVVLYLKDKNTIPVVRKIIEKNSYSLDNEQEWF